MYPIVLRKLKNISNCAKYAINQRTKLQRKGNVPMKENPAIKCCISNRTVFQYIKSTCVQSTHMYFLCSPPLRFTIHFLSTPSSSPFTHNPPPSTNRYHILKGSLYTPPWYSILLILIY